MSETNYYPQNGTQTASQPKFCKHCGAAINADAVICTSCGRQVEELKGQQAAQPQPSVIVNNMNTNANYMGMGKAKSKWVAFVLCLFFGGLGVHKFYEGKIGMGILYVFTLGLFGIGALVDLIMILFKPTTYYV